MRTSHVPGALTATKEIGRLVRDLRRQRHMTGEQLGHRVGISQSRISKIENGYSSSIDSDQLQQIINILKPPKIIRQRLLMLMPHFSVGVNSQFVYMSTDPVSEGNDLQKVTSLFRCYVMGVSSVLQTVEFRTAILKHLGFSEKEISLEIGKAIERQEALWDASKTFHIIMPEAALYTMPANARVQLAQLDRLERMVGLRNASIGIIPLQAGISLFETSTFTFYDDRILYVFMGNRVVRLEDSDTLIKYLNAFEELSRMACFDTEALVLIRKAADYFSGDDSVFTDSLPK